MMQLEPLPAAAMIPRFPPVWADLFGEDQFGIFAQFSVAEVPFVWRWIPPGRFLMGSPAEELGSDEDERPQHTVTISRGFWLGETPVTLSQWRTVIGDHPNQVADDERPVEGVTWHRCLEFAAKLKERIPGFQSTLPTEAQWEYACRGGRPGGAFQNGSPCTVPKGRDPALDELGWYRGNSEIQTYPVKQKQPNQWGLYDLHGNVWEWCFDGMRKYTDQPESDPVGSMDSGSVRVVRGGSWGDYPSQCRVGCRCHRSPGKGWVRQGFRLSAVHESGA